LVLHHALKQAARDGLTVRNVADLVSPPRVPRHEMQTLSAEQARTFLQAAEGDRLAALYVLALSTGMREGELLGLRWRDVDLTHGSLTVRGTLQRTKGQFSIGEPKTHRSRRPVTLTPQAVAALRKHKATQNEERLRLGDLWQDLDLVFTMEDGRPIHAATLLRHFYYPLLRRAELPRVRFHDLRHSVATLLLGQGVHAKIVADLLGHANIGVTLDVYSHVTPTMQRQAIDALSAVLSG
jgi:integrase